MSSLPTALRRKLESAITQGRKVATIGATKALEALAVHEADPYGHMNKDQRDLRSKLQAQARQLGDRESLARREQYEIRHLAEKLAYDQWHRILFARFLLENDLLISPQHGVSVSLSDCEELATSLGLRDAWAVAAQFAARELPEIFRADDPAGMVELSIEDRKPLIQLVIDLPVEVFTASDSLGWCYQFWQAERKDEVNASGKKIGADELPAVTQLFTEDYMVDFLLDNTLGAWHAGKVLAARPELASSAQSEEELRQAVELPGCPWGYLRFIKRDGMWMPAAGTFDGWPRAVSALRCLDPCMGSGHFVVGMFERLVALRVAEEGVEESEAVAGVIRENIFGLELDARCTQIGAFNLALAAWRRVGYRKLPEMNIACSGLAPNAKEGDWLTLANGDERLRNGMERLYYLFKDAPVLGSLIDPRVGGGTLLEAEFHELQPLLKKALGRESDDAAAHEMAVAAQGIAKAAEILAGQFTLVATNVPYLGRGKQEKNLQDFCERAYPNSKADLATCFVERCLSFCSASGNTSLVTPQNWLFLGTYKALRKSLLHESGWAWVCRLGPKGFQTPMWDFNICLLSLTRTIPRGDHRFIGFDISEEKDFEKKRIGLLAKSPRLFSQADQIKNPDARIVFDEASREELLVNYAESIKGLTTGDGSRFIQFFWEQDQPQRGWEWFQTTVGSCIDFGGSQQIFLWEGGTGSMQEVPGARTYARGAWRSQGVLVSQMGNLPVTRYFGCAYDNNCAVIKPKNERDLPAFWVFCCSPVFANEVRRIDQSLKPTNAAFEKIPFHLSHWQKVAAEKYPDGLPKPYSSDPTQWLFSGHPKGSGQYLHVALARLLGYQWPRQTGSSFPDCQALGPDGLEKFADDDGIVSLFPTQGEAPAAERLRALLAEALGGFDLKELLAGASPKGSSAESLEEWLRDEFFEQHCALFHNRPFIWQIWDGNKSGFSALVNYHKFTHASLEKLTYAYLGDWIRRQQAAVDAGEAGSDARLLAAKQLQAKLKLILEGEPPYDIFVRWKPLSQQAIGWNPDINDGVRMNLRPFAAADILRKRVKIKWEKDRGTEPHREKKDFPWFWGWDEAKQDFEGVGTKPDGNRWNDCHYTNEFKKNARRNQHAR